MPYLVSSAAHPSPKQRQVWHWYAENGITSTEVVEPLIVDPDQATITVQRTLPVEGQENRDFPELQTDEHLKVMTVRETVPLTVPPPSWMLRPAS